MYIILRASYRVRVQKPEKDSVGRWQRDIGGLKFIRERKARLRDQLLHAKGDTGFKALATAWNRKLGLRAGDRITPGIAFRWRGRRAHKLIKLGKVGPRVRNILQYVICLECLGVQAQGVWAFV